MSTTSITLWQAVDALVSGMPLSVEQVQAVLHTRLVEDVQQGNESFQFYKSDPVSLSGAVVIRELGLRVRRSPPYPAFLLLELAGHCLTREELRSRYADLRLTEVPRGRSPDEATTYSSSASWGRLSFGFRASSPKCVAFVAFDPVELR